MAGSSSRLSFRWYTPTETGGALSPTITNSAREFPHNFTLFVREIKQRFSRYHNTVSVFMKQAPWPALTEKAIDLSMRR